MRKTIGKTIDLLSKPSDEDKCDEDEKRISPTQDRNVKKFKKTVRKTIGKTIEKNMMNMASGDTKNKKSTELNNIMATQQNYSHNQKTVRKTIGKTIDLLTKQSDEDEICNLTKTSDMKICLCCLPSDECKNCNFDTNNHDVKSMNTKKRKSTTVRHSSEEMTSNKYRYIEISPDSFEDEVLTGPSTVIDKTVLDAKGNVYSEVIDLCASSNEDIKDTNILGHAVYVKNEVHKHTLRNKNTVTGNKKCKPRRRNIMKNKQILSKSKVNRKQVMKEYSAKPSQVIKKQVLKGGSTSSDSIKITEEEQGKVNRKQVMKEYSPKPSQVIKKQVLKGVSTSSDSIKITEEEQGWCNYLETLDTTLVKAVADPNKISEFFF